MCPRIGCGTAPRRSLSLEDNAISKVYYTGQLKSRGLIDSKKVNELRKPDPKRSSW